MEAVSYTKFRKNLKHYILEVNEDSTALLVTNRDDTENDAVLLSKRDYDNIMENLKVMKNSYLMNKIRDGQKQIAAGKTTQHELIDGDD